MKNNLIPRPHTGNWEQDRTCLQTWSPQLFMISSYHLQLLQASFISLTRDHANRMFQSFFSEVSHLCLRLLSFVAVRTHTHSSPRLWYTFHTAVSLVLRKTLPIWIMSPVCTQSMRILGKCHIKAVLKSTGKLVKWLPKVVRLPRVWKPFHITLQSC